MKHYNEIHRILLAESERIGLPKFYKNDLLVHDLRVLWETETQNFLWCARTCGTHLIPLDKNIRDTSRWAMAVTSGGDAENLFYHFDRETLRSVDRKEFVGLSSGRKQ